MKPWSQTCQGNIAGFIVFWNVKKNWAEQIWLTDLRWTILLQSPIYQTKLRLKPTFWIFSNGSKNCSIAATCSKFGDKHHGVPPLLGTNFQQICRFREIFIILLRQALILFDEMSTRLGVFSFNIPHYLLLSTGPTARNEPSQKISAIWIDNSVVADINCDPAFLIFYWLDFLFSEISAI